MSRRVAAVLGTVVGVWLAALGGWPVAEARLDAGGPLAPPVQTWFDDLSELRAKRRVIRVLVSYNRTNFYMVRGKPYGLEYELLRRYERHLNRSVLRRGIKTNLVFIAVPFSQLIPSLLAGRGDIVAAGLTAIPDLAQRVALSTPYITDVHEVVVAAKGVTGLNALSDLAGRRVHVLAGSSHQRHLARLNADFRETGRAPMQVVPVDQNLEAEDILQMVNSGIFDLTVVDHHLACLWAAVLPEIVVRDNLVVNWGGSICWAVRRENPELLASLNAFIRTHGPGTLVGNVLFRRYYTDTRWIRNPLTTSEQRKFLALEGYFKKYAARYGFDWLKIAALAYRESGFNQKARSRIGAVGVMQILPSTAADPNVAIPDVAANVENNIHAGVKYLAFLRRRYFSAPAISPEAQVDFTFAAYNAGPKRINIMRQRARSAGLDPNVWFFNVEHMARRYIGQHPVQFVADINKYYAAYKSSQVLLEKRSRERRLLEAGEWMP